MPRHSAQLARVSDRRPRAAALPGAPLRLLLKLHARLAHFVADGVVMCVVQSLEPIVDVCALPAADDSDSSSRVLVSAADGAVWRVTLPATPSPALHHVLLQSDSLSSVESIGSLTQMPLATPETGAGVCHVELLCRIPGVQTVLQCDDCTVCTSVIAPTTLVWATAVAAGDSGGAPLLVELEELEAEQSTCVVALCSADGARVRSLAEALVPDATRDARWLLVLQGDADGGVRYSLVSAATPAGGSAAPRRSGKLLEIGEPVQFVVPFASSASTMTGGVLVVGTSGRARLLLPTSPSSKDTASGSGVSIAFGAPIQSVVFLESQECVVYCSKGAVYGFRVCDVVARSRSSVPTTVHTNVATKLPFRAGVVAIALHEDSQALSLVYVSGRVVSMDQRSVADAIASVLPRLSAEPADGKESRVDSRAGDTTESRIKSLLQRIAQVSSSSAALRTQSEQMDVHLRDLHAALQIQKLVQASGVDAMFTCRLDMSIASSDSFARAKTVTLKCRVSAGSNLELLESSLSCWHVSIHVRSRQQLVATFVYRLQDVLSSQRPSGAERSMVLDEDTLEHHDAGGMIYASCSLLFQPGSVLQQLDGRGAANEDRRDAHTRRNGESESRNTSLFSFVIPLVRDKAFYLVQLSELMKESDVPTSHMAIKAAFRQDHDATLASSAAPAPTSNSSYNSNKDHPGVLLQGFQLWSALAEHWRDKSFAALWLRDPQEQREVDVAPPSRFTMVFPAFAVRELSLDHVVAVVRSVLNLAVAATPRLHESCRKQGGKFWFGWKTFAGNAVVLRFALADGVVEIDGEMLRPLEVLVQCSSADDLSVMRALLVERVPRSPGYEEMSMPLDEVLSALSLEAADCRGVLNEAEALAEVVAEKVASSLSDPTSCSLCTDEVVRMLADLARVETQALKIYWKARQVLNKFVI